jgi:hypothetical protein
LELALAKVMLLAAGWGMFLDYKFGHVALGNQQSLGNSEG